MAPRAILDFFSSTPSRLRLDQREADGLDSAVGESDFADVPLGPAVASVEVVERLLHVLGLAESSSGERKVIIYVGDGGGTCGGGAPERAYLVETLQLVAEQNAGRAQINTIGVLMRSRPALNAEFLIDLAAANGGSYTRIE